MRTQLMAGQFLDVLESARGVGPPRPADRVDSARNVIRYKSAKYTVEHPLLIGAAVGGRRRGRPGAPLARTASRSAGRSSCATTSSASSATPTTTGKPAGDDLREGKRTVLVALTLQAGDADQTGLFEKLFGQPDLDADGVAELRGVIADTGAVEQVETMIAALAARVAGGPGPGAGPGPPGGRGPRVTRRRDDVPHRLTGSATSRTSFAVLETSHRPKRLGSGGASIGISRRQVRRVAGYAGGPRPR